jgi:hypothetical protein
MGRRYFLLPPRLVCVHVGKRDASWCDAADGDIETVVANRTPLGGGCSQGARPGLPAWTLERDSGKGRLCRTLSRATIGRRSL